MNKSGKGDGPTVDFSEQATRVGRSHAFEGLREMVGPEQAGQPVRHGEREASLEQVDRKSEQRLEQECADHDGAQQDEEPLGCVNADRAGDFEGAVEVGVGLNRFGLNDQPDHRDDDRSPKISTMLLVKMLNSKNTERLRSC